MTFTPFDWQPKLLFSPLKLSWLDKAQIEVLVLRLDAIDPLISGNKWFKLKYHLQAAIKQSAQGIISLGGAHSNHLHALAAAGQRFNVKTVGLLRGKEQETSTTRDLKKFGMQLHWLGYAGYRARNEEDFWIPWLQKYTNFYPVPEGGGGELGELGCQSLVADVRNLLSIHSLADYDAWWLAVGTGTTLTGIANAEEHTKSIYGALAVPTRYGVELSIRKRLDELKKDHVNIHIVDASRAGFGKTDVLLKQFIQTTNNESDIVFEPVYTAKALMKLQECVEQGVFLRGSRILFVHTGGLQGLNSGI